MWGNSAYFWNTMPTSRRCAGMRDTSTPSMHTEPLSGCSKPAIIISNVVLPDPLGPSSATNSPRPTERLTPSTALKLP